MRLYSIPTRECFRLSRPDKLAGRFNIEPEDDWFPAFTSPQLKPSG